MKVIFFACCMCFPSSFLIKKDIAQCSITLYAEWVLKSISQFPLQWLAIIAQSDMLYCKFIFVSNICIFQYELSDSILRIWHENFEVICNRKWKSRKVLLLTISTQVFLIDNLSSSENWVNILRTAWRSVCWVCMMASAKKTHFTYVTYMVVQAQQNRAWYLQNSHWI